MASLKRIWILSLACSALLLCGRAVAQAPAAAPSGYTDITADSADRDETAHKTVYKGAVEVVLDNGARLTCDTLTVFTYPPGEGPNAGKPAPAKSAQSDTGATDSIKQLVAEGHVFYATQNETVKGDRGVYDAEPDVLTMTGNVVAVQGKNVARGDKLVMDRKTNHTTMVSTATGRNNPNRVRGVFYNQNNQSQTGQGQAQPAPAKKP